MNFNGGCQHVCKNIIGSYKCFCNYGHLLEADGHSCKGNDIVIIATILVMHHNNYIPLDKDINECSDSNGGCQHNCTNTIGIATIAHVMLVILLMITVTVAHVRD